MLAIVRTEQPSNDLRIGFTSTSVFFLSLLALDLMLRPVDDLWVQGALTMDRSPTGINLLPENFYPDAPMSYVTVTASMMQHTPSWFIRLEALSYFHRI
jgi:hypothetical protein